MILRISILLLSSLLLNSCRENKKNFVQKGFYYWKSDSNKLTSTELSAIQTLGVSKLYVKFFEVKMDKDFEVPTPHAKTRLWNFDHSADYVQPKNTLPARAMAHLEVIPTVFIENEVFLTTSATDLDSLASNVVFLINKYQRERFKNYSTREIQIDCDWTQKTKDNYFVFLQSIKKISGKTTSCTLRLYPYKYKDKMGIPPADKAILMCYNLTSPLKPNQNSIQDNTELKAYLKDVDPYPLHLDIALPIFSWMQIYQNGQFMGIVSPDENIKEYLKPVGSMWYEVEKDLELQGFLLRKGDQAKIEEVTVNQIKQSISLLKKYVTFGDSTSVLFFHLDTKNINQIENEKLQSFYTDFAE
jgi:hypothetical protein